MLMLSQIAQTGKSKRVWCDVLSSVVDGYSSKDRHISKGLERIRESIAESGKQSIVAGMQDVEEEEGQGRWRQVEGDDAERAGGSLLVSAWDPILRNVHCN